MSLYLFCIILRIDRGQEVVHKRSDAHSPIRCYRTSLKSSAFQLKLRFKTELQRSINTKFKWILTKPNSLIVILLHIFNLNKSFACRGRILCGQWRPIVDWMSQKMGQRSEVNMVRVYKWTGVLRLVYVYVYVEIWRWNEIKF